LLNCIELRIIFLYSFLLIKISFEVRFVVAIAMSTVLHLAAYSAYFVAAFVYIICVWLIIYLLWCSLLAFARVHW